MTVAQGLSDRDYEPWHERLMATPETQFLLTTRHPYNNQLSLFQLFILYQFFSSEIKYSGGF